VGVIVLAVVGVGGYVVWQKTKPSVAENSLSNMKQVCLGALMYVQDYDEALPLNNWPESLDQYIRNRQVYGCPGAPGMEVAVALNAQLAGVNQREVANPPETILFFSSDNGADAPWGGAESVAPARFDGMISVGFVDGHAKTMAPEDAKMMLDRDPFK